MKLSLRLLLLLPFIFVLVGCPKDDAPQEEVIRNAQEVYNEDIAEIEAFMNTHFVDVDADMNVTFTKITATTPGTPIKNHPNLTFKTVNTMGVDHKLYFLKLREGAGNTNVDALDNDQPTKLDSVFVAYKGDKLNYNATSSNYEAINFETAVNPTWLPLERLILGWQEVFPSFKRGNFAVNNATGSTSYTDFGAGVMFVPSGLAYFAYPPNTSSIGKYTPLIFSFKLMNLKYRDHDSDKVLTKNEYLGTGLVSGSAKDTDGDGKPDYNDNDDDNDGTLTKEEVRITPGVTGWHEFANIPLCTGINGKKKHIDASCH